MRIATAIFALAFITLAPPAHAQRAVQLTPDGDALMINKQLGSSMWSIVVDFDARTVAGNVFNLDGSDPQFIFCDILESGIASPADFANFESVVLECKGADGCGTLPCSPVEWTEIGQVPVITSFFLPPGTLLGCNQVSSPQCAGTCNVVPGSVCVPLGQGCSCIVPTPHPTATPTHTPLPQPTFTFGGSDVCCKHCTTGKPCGDSCISFSFICHQPPGCACF
jgi:hypothetical protein